MSNNLTATAEKETGVQLSQFALARRSQYAEMFTKSMAGLNVSLTKDEVPAELSGAHFEFEDGVVSPSAAKASYMKSITTKGAKACDTPLERAIDYIVKVLDDEICGGVFTRCGIRSDFGNTKGAFINLTRSGDAWSSASDCNPAPDTNKALDSSVVEFELKRNVWTCQICSLDANGLGMDAADVARFFADAYAQDERALQDRLVLNEFFVAANNGDVAFFDGSTLPSDAPITHAIIEMVTSIRNAGGRPCIAMDNGLYSKLLMEQMTADLFKNVACCTPKLQPNTDRCATSTVSTFNIGAAAGTDIHIVDALGGGNVAGAPDGAATDWGDASGGDLSALMVFDPSAIALRFGDRSYNKYKLFWEDCKDFYTHGCITAHGTVQATAVVCDPKLVTYWLHKK